MSKKTINTPKTPRTPKYPKELIEKALDKVRAGQTIYSAAKELGIMQVYVRNAAIKAKIHTPVKRTVKAKPAVVEEPEEDEIEEDYDIEDDEDEDEDD